MYASWQLRLLLLGDVRYRKDNHDQQEVTSGSLGYIRQPYNHYGFSRGLAHWIERHNAYSTNEVEHIHRLRKDTLRLGAFLNHNGITRRRCLQRLAARLGFRLFFRFMYIYVWRLGLFEGRAGLIFYLLRLGLEIHITATLAEAEVTDRTDGTAD